MTQLGAIVPASLAPARVIDWHGRPEVVTITFVPVNDPSGVAPVLFNSLAPFRARLTWGTGGGAVSAVIDYPLRGGTLTLTTTNLTVDVFADGVASFAGGATVDKAVQIGAFMGPGASRPNLTPPTFTYERDDVVLNLNGGIVPVPQFGRAYYIEDNFDWAFAPAADQLAWKVQCQNRGTPYPQPGALTQVLRYDMAWIGVTNGHTRTAPLAGAPLALPPRTTHVEVLRQAGYGPPSSRLAVVFILDIGA